MRTLKEFLALGAFLAWCIFLADAVADHWHMESAVFPFVAVIATHLLAITFGSRLRSR
jgi:membrane protein implicated in regulation of membrane protease activity